MTQTSEAAQMTTRYAKYTSTAAARRTPPMITETGVPTFMAGKGSP